jgi:hypothetical protein
MTSLTTLLFDAVFALSAVGFAAWSTRGVLSSVPSKSTGVRARVQAESTASPRSGQPAGVLVEALVRMGFKRLQAQQAATETSDHRNEPLDVQVREALRVLT